MHHMPSPSFFPEKDNTALVVVDIQDNLLKALQEDTQQKVIYKSSLLIRYFRHNKMPIVMFEQYPKGIGPTNQAIKDVLGEDYKPIVKSCFSGVKADGFADAISKVNKQNIILVGIESHICVLQTCCDLLATGKRVFVPADAVGSRYKLDWKTSLANMATMGATVTTTEVLIFRWMSKAGTDEFKAMLPHLK